MKFIELPISLFDRKLQDMGLPLNDIPVRLKVDPNQIVAYRDTPPNDEDNEVGDKTTIYLSSGESFRIELPMEEFERLLN